MTMTKRVSIEQAATITIHLDINDCASCGVVFGVSHEFMERRRDTGETFYCPNGHSLSYGKSRMDKLREELEATEKRLKWAKNDIERTSQQRDAAEGSLRATKGVVTKLKKRVANGVCPCCNRQFSQLHRHMTTQHPDYVTTKEVTS